MVQINTVVEYQGVVGYGAGIVLSPDGIVLTNNHVVAGADTITASNVGTGQTFKAQLLGYDRTEDVALIQLLGAGGLPTAPIGDSNQVTVGEPVVSLGNANGNGSPISREDGQVTTLGADIEAEDELTGSSEELSDLIGFAAPLRPGDSGGPLVSSTGQVIGLNVAASVNYRLGTPGGKGFAIPINRAMGIARPDPVEGAVGHRAYRRARDARHRRRDGAATLGSWRHGSRRACRNTGRTGRASSRRCDPDARRGPAQQRDRAHRRARPALSR